MPWRTWPALLALAAAGGAANALTTEIIRLDFESDGLERLDTHGGRWEVREGALAQTEEGGAAAVALVKVGPWSTYRTTVRARATRPLKKGEGFGLIAGAVDDRTYYLFRLIQKKGGLFGELLRQDRERVTLVGDALVGDLAPLDVDPTAWHELRLDMDAVHLCAYLDGKRVLLYGFTGRPSATYPHNPPWRQDIVGGVPGLWTRGVPAAFDDLRAERLDDGDAVASPLRPPRDREGILLPRRPYGEVMRDLTEWFLRARQVVEYPDAVPPVAAGWDPVIFASYINIDDDLRGVGDIQYPGHNHPPTIIGLADDYLYSGDRRAVDKARELADWNLRYSVPEGWATAGLPLSHFDYKKVKPDGSYEPPTSNFEPDKAANSGLAYMRLHAVTGDKKYLDAAVRIADVLVGLQLPAGNFPFRINPRTGKVEAEYTCSIFWYIEFFDLLAGFAPNAKYGAARDRAFRWLLDHPVKDNNWRGFYGDVPSEGLVSYDQWTALDTAMYLIDRRGEDPTYLDKARSIIAWCDRTLVRHDGYHPGVPALVEQTLYPAILTHHVVRLADAYGRLYGATGDPEHRRLALEIANSVSWLQKGDGKFAYGLWYHAQGNAYILNFNSIYLRLMAEIPETAPAGESHLLRHSGNVREVAYGERMVTYKTWGPGRERLKLAREPRAVHGAGERVSASDLNERGAAGWFWNKSTSCLDVRHAGPAEVAIELP